MNRQNRNTRSALGGTESDTGERTLLPMLIGGLVLIVVGAVVINLFV